MSQITLREQSCEGHRGCTGSALVFLPQNFEKVVRTYQCHLLFCICRLGVALLGSGGNIATLQSVITLI